MSKKYFQFKKENAMIFDFPKELSLVSPRVNGKKQFKEKVIVIYIEKKDLIEFELGKKKNKKVKS